MLENSLIKKSQDNDDILKAIEDCKKCGSLPKLKCDSMKTGKSKILILGESPAKDGWIVSKKAFYNINGKLQSTGKVLERLLNLCGLTLDDVYFTEVCKCIIEDRKRLRECSQNCKPILLKQLENYDFDIILPMGKHPTETILGIKMDKLCSVVGKIFEMKIGDKTKKVIPIYHTSPANPLCYKGNENIFKETLCNILQS